jgi:hypothetical protein
MENCYIIRKDSLVFNAHLKSSERFQKCRQNEAASVWDRKCKEISSDCESLGQTEVWQKARQLRKELVLM